MIRPLAPTVALALALAVVLPGSALAGRVCPPARLDEPLPGVSEARLFQASVSTARFPGQWQEGEFGGAGLLYRLYADGSGTVSDDLRLRGWHVDFACDLSAGHCTVTPVAGAPVQAVETARAIGACLIATPPQARDRPTRAPAAAPTPHATPSTAKAPTAASAVTKPATVTGAQLRASALATNPPAAPTGTNPPALAGTQPRAVTAPAQPPAPAPAGTKPAPVTGAEPRVAAPVATRPTTPTSANPQSAPFTGTWPPALTGTQLRAVTANAQPPAPGPTGTKPTTGTESQPRVAAPVTNPPATLPAPAAPPRASRLPIAPMTPAICQLPLPTVPAARGLARRTPPEAQPLCPSALTALQLPSALYPAAGAVPPPCWADRLPEEPAPARLQRMLLLAGYDAGPVDGHPGPRTRAALRAALGAARATAPQADQIAALRARLCDPPHAG